jgi:YlmC/YmxH family sporulation protein
MPRIADLKQKEVINISDGFRFGYVCDLEIDTEDGCIKKIIVPAPGKVLGLFGSEQEYHIKWNDIRKIGEDVILVEAETDKVIFNC